MTDEEAAFLAAIDERVKALEALVERALCKCRVDQYGRAFNGCAVHSQFEVLASFLGDFS